jgi:hypothetical protein
MKVFVVHGLGHQERNPDSWQPSWKATLQEMLNKWNPDLKVEVDFAIYDKYFAETPMSVGGTLGGFGRLLWDEVRFSVTDKVSALLGRRRGLARR